MGSTNTANSSQSPANLAEDELADLRRIILGGDPEEVLNRPIRPDELSELLPQALPQALLQAGENQDILTQSVLPSVELAIQESVRRDINILSDALFPVIGPASRKSIGDTIGNLVQSLNQTLEYSLSPQSFKWRIEAWRTGKTFAEVVLLRTLIYQVEQVFLIHKDSGLLVQHLIADTITAQDPDLVSAMLTAIEDFVRDSFTLETDTPLDTLKIGELSVWVEDSPQTVLACVIRGNAPQALRTTLEQTQEKVHLLYGPALETYDGDASKFEGTKMYLEDCFQSRFVSAKDASAKDGESADHSVATGDGTVVEPPKKKMSKGRKILAKFIAVCLLVGLATLCFCNFRATHQWKTYLNNVDQQPGLMIVRQGHHWGQFHLVGLRDPLAADPAALLAQTSLASERVQMDWKPYLSLEPEFARQRLNGWLSPAERAELYRQASKVPREE